MLHGMQCRTRCLLESPRWTQRAGGMWDKLGVCKGTINKYNVSRNWSRAETTTNMHNKASPMHLEGSETIFPSATGLCRAPLCPLYPAVLNAMLTTRDTHKQTPRCQVHNVAEQCFRYKLCLPGDSVGASYRSKHKTWTPHVGVLSLNQTGYGLTQQAPHTMMTLR
jgi:hypothetical protein